MGRCVVVIPEAARGARHLVFGLAHPTACGSLPIGLGNSAAATARIFPVPTGIDLILMPALDRNLAAAATQKIAFVKSRTEPHPVRHGNIAAPEPYRAELHRMTAAFRTPPDPVFGPHSFPKPCLGVGAREWRRLIPLARQRLWNCRGGLGTRRCSGHCSRSRGWRIARHRDWHRDRRWWHRPWHRWVEPTVKVPQRTRQIVRSTAAAGGRGKRSAPHKLAGPGRFVFAGLAERLSRESGGRIATDQHITGAGGMRTTAGDRIAHPSRLFVVHQNRRRPLAKVARMRRRRANGARVRHIRIALAKCRAVVNQHVARPRNCRRGRVMAPVAGTDIAQTGCGFS